MKKKYQMDGIKVEFLALVKINGGSIMKVLLNFSKNVLELDGNEVGGFNAVRTHIVPAEPRPVKCMNIGSSKVSL
jgi:hypothetical protein